MEANKKVYELKPLSVGDGKDIYDMLQEIPRDENGFQNGFYKVTYEEFKKKLIGADNMSKGTDLADWMVPQSSYWLYAGGKPVGYGKIRHKMTEKLLAEGGNIGYCIRPSERGKGYGSLILKLLLEKAGALDIHRVLLTIYNENIPSIKVAIKNGGALEKVSDTRHYFWIDC